MARSCGLASTEGLVGSLLGAVGTAVAQADPLRNGPGYLNVPMLSQPEVYVHFTPNLIDDEGNISNDGQSRKNLEPTWTGTSPGSETQLITWSSPAANEWKNSHYDQRCERGDKSSRSPQHGGRTAQGCPGPCSAPTLTTTALGLLIRFSLECWLAVGRRSLWCR